jgi:hypothetical protein
MIGYLLVPVGICVTLAWQLILWAEFSPRRPSPAEQGSRGRHPSARPLP